MIKNKYSIIKLCKYLGCSKSGYYDWVKAGRPQFKAFNDRTNELILKTYEKHPEQGIRPIRMNIKVIIIIIILNLFKLYFYIISFIYTIIKIIYQKFNFIKKVPNQDKKWPNFQEILLL